MYIFSVVILIITSLVIAYERYQIASTKSRKILYEKRKLHGRTAVVTGGMAGTGLEIAMDFARRGAKVIIAGPDEIIGYTALISITKVTGNHNVLFKLLNLSSLESVRNLAANILKEETRLDILVNNAAVKVGGDHLTDDGIHLTMQVNYYGHFLLTLLLLPLLKKTATESEPCRIINRTTSLFKKASLDVDKFNETNFWPKLKIYANSQLCFVMFSRELAKRLTDSNVIVNCAVPGLNASGMYQNINEYIARIVNTLIYVFFNMPWRRAHTAIHAAVEEKAGQVSGKVYENCKLTDAKENGDFDASAEKLWEQSVKLVKLQENELNVL